LHIAKRFFIRFFVYAPDTRSSLAIGGRELWRSSLYVRVAVIVPPGDLMPDGTARTFHFTYYS